MLRLMREKTENHEIAVCNLPVRMALPKLNPVRSRVNIYFAVCRLGGMAGDSLEETDQALMFLIDERMLGAETRGVLMGKRW